MANTNAFQITKHSKRFWQDRVYRPEIKRKDGSRDISPNYAVRLSHAGRNMRLSLGTPNQAAAANLAYEMFGFLTANGWIGFLARYRSPDPQVAVAIPAPDKKTDVTVGDFLAAVRDESDLSRKTFDSYATCFRFIISEIRSIKKTRDRHDYRNGGRKKWTSAIDAMLLEEITPEHVRIWKRVYVDRAGRDEIKRRRYTVSCNSYLRRARALFSKRNVLDKLRSIQLPPVLPFDGVQLEPRTDTKFYGAGIDPLVLLRLAVKELAGDREEELKAFLLAITLGLRRREIDLLEWPSFDFVAGSLRIVPTRWYQLKTNESASELPVEREVLELFRGWRARASGEFVLESNRPPKSVDYQHYRCEETFQALLAWLRSKRVQGNKPLHAMRKLYGSALADLHGLHAASSGLRYEKTTKTLTAARADLLRLNEQDQKIRSTTDEHEKLHRAEKIGKILAEKSVLEGDIASLELELNTVCVLLITHTQHVFSALSEIVFHLASARAAGAKEMIERLIDTSFPGVVVGGLEQHAKSVHALDSLRSYFQGPTLEALRFLRKNFDQLREMVEDERSLVLPPVSW